VKRITVILVSVCVCVSVCVFVFVCVSLRESIRNSIQCTWNILLVDARTTKWLWVSWLEGVKTPSAIGSGPDARIYRPSRSMAVAAFVVFYICVRVCVINHRRILAIAYIHLNSDTLPR